MEPKPNPDSQPAPEPKPETATPPTSGSPLSIRNLLPGMVIGILVGIAGFLAYHEHLPQITQTFYVVTLTSFGVLILTFILLYAFKKQISTLIFGSQAANAGEIIEDAQKVSDAIINRFTDQLLKDAPEVRDRVRFILPRLANWFVWSRFRNWWWQWVLGIFVSLGGLTGTLLLMNQNALLEAQNIKIDSQTELMSQQMLLSEASRKSALIVLMSNIMDKVDREIESQQKGLSYKQKDGRKYKLSQSLIGQIAALSYSFKPYQYMGWDDLIEEPLSPERGHLLITLTLLPLDTFTLQKIYRSATFERADLQEASSVGADLRGANLEWADLSGANLSGANLSSANLSLSDLSSANLSLADLGHADLGLADLGHADLGHADLTYANLANAYLSEADMIGADLFRADLRNADLGKADLSKANLKDADLSKANLNETNLNINQLSESKSLWNCGNLHDSIILSLNRRYRNLFQEPKEK